MRYEPHEAQASAAIHQINAPGHLLHHCMQGGKQHRKTKILGHCTVLVDNSSKTLDNRALVVFALSLTAACLQLAIANVPPASLRAR